MTITATPHDWHHATGAGFTMLGVDFPDRRELCLTYDSRRYPTADDVVRAALLDPQWRRTWTVTESRDVSLPIRFLSIRSLRQ